MNPFPALSKALTWTEAFGVGPGLRNLRQLAGRSAEARFQLAGSGGSVTARRNRSDTVMFHQVFALREYDYDLGFAPATILDAGANAGYATRFFRGKFPRAAIAAVEPDAENCRLFERNTAGLPGVRLFQGGVWSDSGALRFAQPGAPKSELRLEAADGGGAEATATEGAVRAYTIPEILRAQGWAGVDLVKLDVEGAEREIFERGDPGWLRQTRALIVELHDRTTPGCGQALFNCLHGLNYTLEQRGDTLLVRLTPPLRREHPALL